MEILNLAEDAEEFTANVYLMGDILVDTGTNREIEEKLDSLEAVGCVLMTHTHYDHLDLLQKLVEDHDPEIYCFDSSRLDVESDKIRELEDGEGFEACGKNFRAFHTPGHIDDHLCFYMTEEKVLFSGDLIFAEGGFGRTDLEEGDRELLIESIRKIIRETDPERVYCGHDTPILKNVSDSLERSVENAEKREPKY